MIKLISIHGVYPAYKTISSAGADIFANESAVFNQFEIKFIPTGIKIMNPWAENRSRYFLDMRLRSSLCKKGLMLANGAGVIDADYDGEIMVPLISMRDNVVIEKDDRIAQLILMKYEDIEGIIRNDTVRNGGFGSTGI